jgi:hypothetical protein
MKTTVIIAVFFSCVCVSVLNAQPSASLEWVAHMGGASFDYSYSVAVDSDGNVIATGDFRGTADFDPGTGVFEMTSYGIRDIFVVKLNAAGQLLWAKQFGGTDNDYSKSVTTDASGNIYFTGNFKGTADFDPGAGQTLITSPNGADNAFICKLDANGALSYVKHIVPDPGFPGIPSSGGKSVKIDNAGNVIVCGTYGGGNDFDPGAGEFILTSTWQEMIFLLKLTNDGQFIWAKRMGGRDVGSDQSLAIDATNNILLTGIFDETPDFDPGSGTFFMTSDGWDDIFVTKMSSSGDFLWAKQFGGTSWLSGMAVSIDQAGYVYCTGMFQFDVDFDPGPGIYNMSTTGNTQIYLVKLNTNGNFCWAKQFGMGNFSNQQGGYAITNDADCNIYLAGLFYWTIDFDPGPDTTFLTSNGGQDIFIAKYDSSGSYLWAKSAGSTGESDHVLSVQSDASGNVYLTGHFQLTVDFNPGYQVNNVTSFGQTDAYVLKLSQCNNTGLTITETACDLYTLNGVDYDSSGTFYQYFINSQGCDSIITLNLTVNRSPSIITESDTINRCINTPVDITVIADGTSPLLYQWYKDGSILSSETSETIYLNAVQPSDDSFYTCEITNSCGSITTTGTTLQVIQITVYPGSDTAFCNSNPVQLLATATSNYPAVSGAFSFLWSPPEGLSATNIPNPVAQPMGDTQYQIVANDQNNCPGMAFLNVYSNTGASITQQPQPLYNLCLSDTLVLQVAADGSSPISFQWKKNGSPIPAATVASYPIFNATLADEGIYTCDVSNLCNVVSTNNIEVNVIQISITASADTGMCKGQSASLSANAVSNHPGQSGTLNYFWSPGTGLNTVQGQNVVANPNSPVTYTVSVADINGCQATEDISVNVYLPYSDEEICLVTVDTLSWKNKIMWEKTNGVGTVGYNVYKEVASNVYSNIGFIPYSNPAEYVDLYSQPESYANRYKISVVDTCGNESDKSYYHNTMNLTIAAFGSTMGLTWTPYSDESGTFMPALYDIYRGTSPSDMTYLASIPGTQTSYNDNNVFTVYYYIVGVTKPGGCNTAKADMVSFSNKKDNTDFIGIEDNLYSAGIISISPNPMSTSATLTIPNWHIANSQRPMANGQLQVMDLTGKVVRTIPIPPHGLSPDKPSPDKPSPDKPSHAQLTIERGDLKQGIYFVELKADRLYRGKLVVE